MAILINKDTKVIVQGITGKAARFHTEQMRKFGTNIVAGVSPGKAGQLVQGIPVFNTVRDAVIATGANASIIFVPAPSAADSIMEAVEAEVPLVVCITSGAAYDRSVQYRHHPRRNLQERPCRRRFPFRHADI